jgi:hypothetical protein
MERYRRHLPYNGRIAESERMNALPEARVG